MLITGIILILIGSAGVVFFSRRLMKYDSIAHFNFRNVRHCKLFASLDSWLHHRKE